MKEVLRYEVDEVAASLCLYPRTAKRYSRQFLNFGNISPEVIGRPLNSVSMHPHVEFLIMEAVLKHPEKTLAEIAYEVYVQTGSQYTLAGVFSYLRRNRFSQNKVSPSFFFFCPLEICPHANCFNVTICDFFLVIS